MSALDRPERHSVEAVVGRDSPLLGSTPKEANFREHYQAAIVGIHREGQPLVAKLGQVKLRVGDTLLLLTDPGFAERWRGRPDFLVVSPLDGEAPLPVNVRKASFVGLVAFTVVVLAGAGLVPILHASLVAAAVLVLSRVVTANAARESVDIDVLVVIAASFGLGAAIDDSGLADALGGGIVMLSSGYGYRVVLLGVVIATVGLTEFISNNAAAALMFPIAVSSAEQVGADPRAFAIAVAVAASASFMTPIGYQTNTMVYGPGGYRFGDYARFGFPLTVTAITACVLCA